MSAFAFGRDRRIRKRADFTRAQRSGRSVRTPHFVLVVLARVQEEGSGPSRLGVVATKKIGNAVVRNRIKRLCRESFRLDPTLLPDGIDLVVIAKTGAGTLKLQDVQSEWAAVSKRLRAECEKTLRSLPA